MASITCGNCKGKHSSVAEVQACYQGKKTMLTLDEVLGTDVNPTFPTASQIADETAAKNETYIADLLNETPAPVAKVVPAHRAAKKKVLVATVPAVVIEDLSAVQAEAKAAVLKTGQDLELGMYQIGDEIFKVKWNKTNTFKYAEKLVITQKHVWDDETNGWKLVPKGKFAYGYYLAKLTSEHKMTEEMAKAFHDATKAKYGVDYGFCCVCGKLLTVKKSIAAGLGPVCASKI